MRICPPTCRQANVQVRTSAPKKLIIDSDYKLYAKVASCSRCRGPQSLSKTVSAMLSMTLSATPMPFSSLPYPLPSTQQRNPSPRIVGYSCTSPSRPGASNTRLEPALSRFSLLPHIKLLHPHLHNHPLCNSLPLSGLISPCRQCLGKQPPGFNRLFSDFLTDLLATPCSQL